MSPRGTCRLRGAREDDAIPIARIYVGSWNEGFIGLLPGREVDESLVARWRHDLAKPTHRWWVAEVNEVVAGFAGIGPSRDPVEEGLGELDTIAVDPPFWRRGIGRALMVQAVHHLRVDYDAAILWTLEDYERGQRFYEATGWHRDGFSRDGGRQIRYTLTEGPWGGAQSGGRCQLP